MNEYIKSKECIVISDSNIHFQDFYDKPYLSEATRAEIKKADILLIAEDGWRGIDHPVFPEETSDFFAFLKANLVDDIVPDICIEDEDYQLLELHADVVNLPTMIALYAALPILTSVIGNYVYDLLKRKRDDCNIVMKIVVQKNGSSKSIEYNGPAKWFEKNLMNVTTSLFDENNDDETNS